MKKSAFLTIEVLISLVIITMGILVASSSLKSFYFASEKKQSYEDLLSTLLTLKDLYVQTDFEKLKTEEGTLNGWDYSLTSQNILSKKTFIYDETGLSGGNSGPYEMTLYKIDIQLQKESFTQSFSYYQTRAKQIADFGDKNDI